MKIAFVCDSGSGLNSEELEMLGVYGVPLQITVNEETKLEGEEIGVDEVNELMKQGQNLKTSLASAQKCEELFIRLKEEGYEMVFAIPICSGLSGTINMMRMCAQEVGIKFDFYDCHVTAMLERYLCVQAKKLYDSGKSIGEIKLIFNDICESANTILIPDDLNHLKKGGRLTPLAATLGGLLKIKPLLQINKHTNGKIDVLDKVRTMNKAMVKTVSVMAKTIPNDGTGYIITVAHVADEEKGKEMLDLCKEAFPNAEFHFIKLVSVVSIHTGLGCLGIQCFKTV